MKYINNIIGGGNDAPSEKPKLRIIELFSGIGAQKRGLENTGLFDVECVATSEIDKDAVVSYAAIHCGLTNELIDSYEHYPPVEEIRNYLIRINLGYTPEKDKKYNWNKSGKKFERDMKKYWLACQLSKNLGDISLIEELPEADVLFTSSPCTDNRQAGNSIVTNCIQLIWEHIFKSQYDPSYETYDENFTKAVAE